MHQESSKQPNHSTKQVPLRPIDTTVEKGSSKLGSRFRLMNAHWITSWRVLLTLLFVAGFASALVFGASKGYFEFGEAAKKRTTSQKAAPVTQTIEGIVEVLHVDDFENNSFQYEYSLYSEKDRTRRPLKGVSGLHPGLAGHKVSIRNADLSGVSAGIQSVSGGTFTDLGVSVAPTGSTGDETVVAVLMNFSDLRDESIDLISMHDMISGSGRSAHRYFNEVSYGQSNLVPYPDPDHPDNQEGVYGWFQLNNPASYYDCFTGMANAAVGQVDDRVDFRNVDRLVIAFPYADHCRFGGRASLGGINLNTDEGVLPIKIAIVNGIEVSQIATLVHELAHNYGLLHASSYKCLLNPLVYQGDNCEGEFVEYGDPYDVLGSGSKLGELNVYFRKQIGWISEDLPIINSSGFYEVSALHSRNPSAPRGLRIRRDATDYYYFEYRVQEIFNQNVSFPGVLVRFKGSGNTQLVLGDTANQNDVLSLGEVFIDEEAGFMVKPTYETENGIVLEVKFFSPTDPYIALNTIPQTQIVHKGENAVFSVQVGSVNNFSSPVSLHGYGIYYSYPMDIQITPQICSVPCAAVMRVITGKEWLPGDYPIIISAIGGQRLLTKRLTLRVVDAPNVRFTLDSEPGNNSQFTLYEGEVKTFNVSVRPYTEIYTGGVVNFSVQSDLDVTIDKTSCLPPCNLTMQVSPGFFAPVGWTLNLSLKGDNGSSVSTLPFSFQIINVPQIPNLTASFPILDSFNQYTTKFESTISNTGTASAGSNKARFEIDLNSETFQNADVTLPPDPTVPTLSAGGSADVVSSAWTLVNGTHAVRVCADADSVIPEGNENDNCAIGTPTITGVNEPPTAQASGQPVSGNAPLAVSFSSSGSSDADGTITGYHWDFGDNTSSTQANPSHTYQNAGTYTATLTVTDNNLATDTDTVTITVESSGGGDGVNLSPESSIGAHSSAYEGEDWTNLIDSDTSGWDGTVTADKVSNTYAIIDLPGTNDYTIAKVRLLTDTGVGFSSRWVKGFRIQTSNTGTASSDFTTVFTGTKTKTAGFQEFTFTPKQAKYVKFIVDSNHGDGSYVHVGELEVWSDGDGGGEQCVTGSWNDQGCGEGTCAQDMMHQTRSVNPSGCEIASQCVSHISCGLPTLYNLTVMKTGSGTGAVASSPGGINCGNDCVEAYGQGSSVTLTAASSTGSTFAGWSGACTGTGACTVAMTQARTVTATFNQQGAGTQNLAAQSTVKASSSTVSGEGWDNLIDGDTSGWDGTVTANKLNVSYVTLDLPGTTARTLTELKILTDTGVGNPTRWVKKFRFQVSTNGTSFSTVIGHSNPLPQSGGLHTFAFPANTKATHVKMIFDENFGNSQYYQAGEMEVWGN